MKNGRPDGNQGIRGRKDAEIDGICAKCPFLPTKPGNISMHIASLVGAAYRMEALLGENASGVYPNFYTPLEWECYLTLKYARAKDMDRDLPNAPKPQQSNVAAQMALGVRR